jgi:hypothetical protein
MSDIFYDNGTVFFVTETGALPPSPYWLDFIRIGNRTDHIESDEHGNSLFTDEDGKVLALQMEDPLTDDGTPKESVLHWLRGTMGESEIVSFLEMMQEAKTQMADSEA